MMFTAADDAGTECASVDDELFGVYSFGGKTQQEAAMGGTGSAAKNILTIAFIIGLAAPLSAAPITGVLSITGDVTVSATTIDWDPDGTNFFATVFDGTLYFEGTDDGSNIQPYYGSAIDLVGQAMPVEGFLHDFKENPLDLPTEYDDLSFTLTNIVAPTADPCTGGEGLDDPCSLGAFTLTQTKSGVEVSFGVEGFFIDITYGDDGSLNEAKGIYTTQLIDPSVDTIAEIIAILDGGGSINASYSATYTASVIPEPATLLTFGAGTVLLAAHRRRRAQRNRA